MRAEVNEPKVKRNKTYGYFYIVLIMMLTVAAAGLFSGGESPLNPVGPGGPPTVPPYSDYTDEQRIILPSTTSEPGKRDLQLETFKVTVCGQTSAIDILIDTSGSMDDDNKLDKLKTALREFMKHLSNNSAISIQTFNKGTKTLVNWDLYKNNKAKVQEAIDSLEADGWTVMRDGFKLAQENLNDVINIKKFPGYKYSLLLISDGVPEIPPDRKRTCLVEVDDPDTAPAKRCFAQEQDPRVPVNIPREIKNKGVPIYAIGLYSQTSSDKQLAAYLEPLLKDIVSQPVSTYYYAYSAATSAEDLKTIFNNIIDTICADPLR